MRLIHLINSTFLSLKIILDTLMLGMRNITSILKPDKINT